jgi:peptide/nickel transport system substrate-binding protein
MRRHWWSGVVMAMLLALAGCGFGDSSSPEGGADQRLVLASNFTPKSAWALETDDGIELSKAGVLEGLTRVDQEIQVQPALAESWKQTNPTTWDFTLRQGVKFHDGSNVDATAVAQALNHVLKVEAPPAAFSPDTVASVKAVDPQTVRITTKGPDPLIPHRMASPNTGILAPAAYQGGKINPVRTGTGPFVLVNEVPKQAITLERNASYWGGEVGLAGAEVRFIPDGGVRATQVRTNEAQIGVVIPIARLPELESAGDVRVNVQSLPRTTALYLNNAKAPFNKKEVRQAIQSAIDVQAIADNVYEGAAKPAVGPFLPDEPWGDPQAKPVARDLDKAKRLLAQAGVAPGSLEVGLWAYHERPELKDVATAIQAMLKEVGITAKIRNAEYAALEPDLFAGKFDMLLQSRNHLSAVADPAGFLTADYTCKGGFNISHFCDPSLDKQIAEASRLADANARYEIYRQVAAKVQADAVDVFLVHEQQHDALHASVQNYRLNPVGYYYLTADLALAAT